MKKDDKEFVKYFYAILHEKISVFDFVCLQE